MIGAQISRWTMSYFAAALLSLLAAGVLIAAGFGYPSAPIEAPDTLVVVHILVIGWLGLLFCGALLQFVPVLVAKPMRAAWVAAPALAAILGGLLCLVTGRLVLGGRLDASLMVLPLAAVLLCLGFGALIVAFLLTLMSSRPLGIPARLVATGLGSLVMTLLLGASFSTILSGIDVPQHLAALLPAGVSFHAAFGLLGWMTLTALGVSYRLFAMFMLAPEGGKATGRWVLLSAIAALGALALTLCATVGDLPDFLEVPALALSLLVTTIGLYCRDVLRIYLARRRKQLELNTGASLVALGFLIVALAALVGSAALDAPARLAVPAVYLLVFGWLSGLGMGQLYKIVPFLTWLECYGPIMGKTAVPRVQDLVNEQRATFWFWLHFMAVGFGGVALVLDAPLAFRAVSSAQTLAVAGLVFEYILARRLSEPHHSPYQSEELEHVAAIQGTGRPADPAQWRRTLPGHHGGGGVADAGRRAQAAGHLPARAAVRRHGRPRLRPRRDRTRRRRFRSAIHAEAGRCRHIRRGDIARPLGRSQRRDRPDRTCAAGTDGAHSRRARRHGGGRGAVCLAVARATVPVSRIDQARPPVGRQFRRDRRCLPHHDPKRRGQPMTARSAAEIEASIRNELQIVLDPEIGRSVVDIGLIYHIDVQPDGAVAIDMTTTTKGCPATSFLVDAVRDCVLDAELARAVEVRLTYDPPWSPDMMAD